MGVDRDAIILDARIHIAGMFDLEGSAVYVRLNGYDEEVKLIEFFPDEISFTRTELIGLTVAEARRLHGAKDRSYLAS